MDWIKCIASRLLRAGRRQVGITLIETVVAIAIFGIVSTALVTVLTSATTADGLARQKSIALELAQQQVEYIRQLGYVNAGTDGGNPSGIVASSQQKQVMGLFYVLNTSIRWVNDPIPAGFVTSANYKRVQVVVSRQADSMVLATDTTYLSSATRAPLGGLNNAIINVQARDYLTTDQLGGVAINLTRPPSSFSSNDMTDNTTGSPDFGQVTFAALTPTGTSEYYKILASRNGYATLKEDLPDNDVLHQTSSLKLVASQTTSTTLRLYKPSSISVHIVDQANGLTYASPATVTISSPRGSQTFSTSTGYVSISSLQTLAGEPIVPGGGYAVIVDTPDHRHGELTNLTVPQNYPTVLSSNFEVSLPPVPIPQFADLTVDVRRVRTDSGHCEDSNEEISSATVTINDPGQSPPFTQSGNTNSDGRIVFTNIPLGTYDIDARKRINGHWRTGGLSGQPLMDNTTLCVAIHY